MGRRYCRVLKCPSKRCRESKMSLFTPPLKDPSMLKLWEEALKKHLTPEDFPFTCKTYICELHFKPDQIDNKFETRLSDGSTWTDKKERIRLFPNSVPTVFPIELRTIKAPKCKLTYVFDVEEGCDDPESGAETDEGCQEQAKDTSEQEETKRTCSGDDDMGCVVVKSEQDGTKENCDGLESVEDLEGGNDAESELEQDETKENCDGPERVEDLEGGKDAESELEQDETKENCDGPERVEDLEGGKDAGSGLEEANIAGGCEEQSKPVVDSEAKVVSHEGSDTAEQSGNNDNLIEIIFSEITDDESEHESGDADKERDVVEVSDCETPHPPESRGSISKKENASSLTDVRAILGPCESKNYVTKDVTEFSRLCRKYIESRLLKKGRPSLMEMYGSGPSSPGVEESLYLYPKVRLDVETLVTHIDHVKLPSANWFCTAKDGSPAFLCWDRNLSIHKVVLFEMETLQPVVQLGGVNTIFTEIVKPKSIHEVSNILKLVESAQRCPEASSECKGYFFPANSEGMNMCRPCWDSGSFDDVTPFTLELVKESAQSILSNFPNWSYTALGTAFIFIGWKKQYIPEKLYIVSWDLTAKVMFGEECPSFDHIRNPKCIKDIQSAIKFLEHCVKCTGVDNVRRSNRCRGYVHHKTLRMRNTTCDACADLKKKLIRAVPGGGVFKRAAPRHVATASLKPTVEGVPSLLEEDNSSGQSLEADEEHVFLPDALEDIALPSNRWTHAVVDGCVIFQYWKDNSMLTKKVLINHDLTVQISVLDRSVQLENVDVVTSVDDVVSILNVVDSLRVCEGYDDSYRKHKDCTGYVYGPTDTCDPAAPYHCPHCAAVRKNWFVSANGPAVENTSDISSGNPEDSEYSYCSRTKPPAKVNVRFVRSRDDSEPPSKRVAVEIEVPPSPTLLHADPGSPTDDR